jgi:hypothetical protein
MIAPSSIASPTQSPTRCPTANSAKERKKSKPVTPRSPTLKYRTTSPANTRVATMIANADATSAPQSTAMSPARFSAAACTPAPSRFSAAAPTFSTSAQATPSG